MSVERGDVTSADDCTAALVRLLTASPRPEATLFVGVVPIRLIGEASLRGPVDVIEPDVARSRLVSMTAPAARIIRSHLAGALARLGDYSTVICGDPRHVKGDWNWSEAFDTLLRIGRMSARGIVMVNLHDAEVDFTTPRTLAQLSSTHARVLAVDALASHGSGLLAYEPRTHDSLAANLLARPNADFLTLEPAFAVGARLACGPFSHHASQAVTITHDIGGTGALLVGQGGESSDVTASPTPFAQETWRPLALALAESILAGDMPTARLLVAGFDGSPSRGQTPESLWSHSVSSEGNLVDFGHYGGIHASAPKDSLMEFCDALLAGARLPRYPDAPSLARALRLSSVGAR